MYVSWHVCGGNLQLAEVYSLLPCGSRNQIQGTELGLLGWASGIFTPEPLQPAGTIFNQLIA